MNCHLIYIIGIAVSMVSAIALPKECRGGLPGRGCRRLCANYLDECPTGYNREYFDRRFGRLANPPINDFAYCICQRPWTEVEAKEMADPNCHGYADNCAMDQLASDVRLNAACDLASDMCGERTLGVWCADHLKDHPRHPGTKRICKVWAIREATETAPCDDPAKECVLSNPSISELLISVNPFGTRRPDGDFDKLTEPYPSPETLAGLNDNEKSRLEQRLLREDLLTREQACAEAVDMCDKIRLEEKCNQAKDERGPDDEGTKRICKAEEQRFELEKGKRKAKADSAAKSGCPESAKTCIKGLDQSCTSAGTACSEEELTFWCTVAKDSIAQNPGGAEKICDVLVKKQETRDPHTDCDEHVGKCKNLNEQPGHHLDPKTEAELLYHDCEGVEYYCSKERVEYWCKTLNGKHPNGLATKHVCGIAGMSVEKRLQKAAEHKGKSGLHGGGSGHKANPGNKGRGIQQQHNKGRSAGHHGR